MNGKRAGSASRTARVAALGVLALAGAVAAGSVSLPLDADDAFALPGRLLKLTENTALMPIEIAEQCVPPSAAQLARARDAYGPHAMVTMNLYASAEAAPLLQQEVRVFPVGTVIVKEKLADLIEGAARAPAIGGMRKREPGYDPAYGDWEYFYAEKGGELEIGRLENCRACHAAVAAKDYVYAVRSGR